MLLTILCSQPFEIDHNNKVSPLVLALNVNRINNNNAPKNRVKIINQETYRIDQQEKAATHFATNAAAPQDTTSSNASPFKFNCVLNNTSIKHKVSSQV